MPIDLSPGHVDYNYFNMLPSQPDIINQSTALAGQRRQAATGSFNQEMQKQYGGMAGGAAMAASGQAADGAAAVATENFNAKMQEATVRAQLHSSYMDLMWKRFQMQKKADRWGRVGAAVGAAGMIGAAAFGGPVQHPEAGGGSDALNFSDDEQSNYQSQMKERMKSGY